MIGLSMMPSSNLFRLAALAGIASTAAWAQVAVPALGLLPNQGQILLVNGIPASASITGAIDFGAATGEFLQIAVSPRQNFALVSAANNGAVLLAYANGTTSPLTGVAAFPSEIAMSPQGSAAVLWFASSRLLEIISGLPGSPAVRLINASFLSGQTSDVPASLAVSDDGAWGAGAWSSGVWAFGPNGETRNLLPTADRTQGERAYALAFFTGTENLAAATRTGIYSVSDVGGSAAVSTLYGAQSGQSPVGPAPSPSGLGISTDNQRLVMTDNAGGILTLNLSSSAVTQMNCGCSPSGVFPMGGSLFRITGLTGSVFRIFDATAGSVFLVPLAPSAATPGSGQQ